jgi:MoaA/NifB/PqqE/SkfB family radical SAM enzyme
MLEIHKQKSLNIDIGNRCTLQCSECARTKFVSNNLPLPGKDLKIAQFDKISDFFIGSRINFCGTFSDPIFNLDFIKMLAMCKKKNIKAIVHTAASHKSLDWYIKAFQANNDATWIFGIDGLPDQSHLYRKNQDGKKMFDILLTAKSMNLPLIWQYIIFDYNKKNVKEAKQLARKHQIELLIVKTNRK